MGHPRSLPADSRWQPRQHHVIFFSLLLSPLLTAKSPGVAVLGQHRCCCAGSLLLEAALLLHARSGDLGRREEKMVADGPRQRPLPDAGSTNAPIAVSSPPSAREQPQLSRATAREVQHPADRPRNPISSCRRPWNSNQRRTRATPAPTHKFAKTKHKDGGVAARASGGGGEEGIGEEKRKRLGELRGVAAAGGLTPAV